MANSLFFQGAAGFEMHHAAMQRWNSEKRPMKWDYEGKSYVILFKEKSDDLHVSCNEATYVYHKDGGKVTLTPPGGDSLSWKEIIANGKGKTIRFHIPDQTPYIREAILFIALSVLTAYGAYKIKNKYFPKEPPPNPRNKVPRRL